MPPHAQMTERTSSHTHTHTHTHCTHTLYTHTHTHTRIPFGVAGRPILASTLAFKARTYITLLPPQTKSQIFKLSKSISHNSCLGEQALNETRDTVKQLEAEQAQLLEYWERDGVLMSERELAIGRRSAVREVQSRLRRDK